MVDVGVWCEWEADVELDAEALARGVTWVVGWIVEECRTAGVAPIGVLTITDRPVESAFGISTIRRAVNLQIDPTAVWDWTPPEPPRQSRRARIQAWFANIRAHRHTHLIP